MAHYEDVKVSTIAYIGLVSALAMFVIVLVLQVLYYQYRNQQTAGDGYAVSRPAELADLVARQQTQLTVPRIVDKDKGLVTIGISRAMELVVSELASGKSPRDVIGPPRATEKVEPTPKEGERSKDKDQDEDQDKVKDKEAADDQKS